MEGLSLAYERYENVELSGETVDPGDPKKLGVMMESIVPEDQRAALEERALFSHVIRNSLDSL